MSSFRAGLEYGAFVAGFVIVVGCAAAVAAALIVAGRHAARIPAARSHLDRWLRPGGFDPQTAPPDRPEVDR